jgi:hypothetical protein
LEVVGVGSAGRRLVISSTSFLLMLVLDILPCICSQKERPEDWSG